MTASARGSEGLASEQHRLPSADAAWLHMDRPTNLMVINSVMLFEERLDWERLRRVIGERLVERYPRFHECVVESRLPLLGPSFAHDRNFDLDRHMHRRGLPAPADELALRELIGDLIAAPLDRGKPLWEIYMIEMPGGAALVVRMHHCLADGIALARVMLSLTDAAPEEDGFAAAVALTGGVARGGVRGVVGGAVDGGIGAARWPLSTAAAVARVVGGGAVREGREVLARPAHALELVDRAAADTRTLAKLLLSPPDAPTALRGELGVARRVAWTGRLKLDRVKRVAHAQGATVNDVLLACVSGALRRHLQDQGEEPRAIRAMVPFNLRALDAPIPRELGNRFGLVYLTLPVDVPSRRERLEELKQRMAAIKRSPEGPMSYAILEAVGLTPPQVESWVVDLFTAKASAVMTNVPGPREVVYLAGSPVRTVLVWAPTSGSVGMSVSIFSYRGEVTIGLLVDAGLVPDPQAIMHHTEQELTALARLKPLA